MAPGKGTENACECTHYIFSTQFYEFIGKDVYIILREREPKVAKNNKSEQSHL